MRSKPALPLTLKCMVLKVAQELEWQRQGAAELRMLSQALGADHLAVDLRTNTSC